jgi:hypothetical protein
MAEEVAEAEDFINTFEKKHNEKNNIDYNNGTFYECHFTKYSC